MSYTRECKKITTPTCLHVMCYACAFLFKHLLAIISVSFCQTAPGGDGVLGDNWQTLCVSPVIVNPKFTPD